MPCLHPASAIDHRPRLGTPWAVAASLVLARSLLGGDVRIHELFYHPPTELDREEWVELANTGAQAIDLSGWRFTEGVRFTFPPGTVLAPGGFLVVAADLPSFQALHPGVTNVVGGWDGILSNSGQQLRLVDAAGKAADSVRYADDGEWAERVRDVVDYGHRGWTWTSAADGGGRSLELRQVALPNGHGRNWSPSTVDGGTPGRANSTATTNLPPILADVRHRPLVPRSSEPVVVNAVVVDEAPSTNILATLHWRVDGAAAFGTVPMFDDGLHGDGAPGDGIVGGTVPPQAHNAVVEFYVAATDPSGQSRTWPAPALDDGVPRQALNALYQVDDGQQAALPRPGELPRYRLVLLAADRAELESINRNSPAAPFPQPAPFNDQTRSHAQFNATFVSVDGTGAELRYLVGVRNRGNGSRTKLPQGLRLHLRNDDLWKQASALNLNSQYTPAQLLGSALYQRAGLAAADSRAVHLRVNNRDLHAPGSPSFGFYVANEVINSEFAARAFPADASGNLYRGIRLTGNGADLAYLGTNAAPYRENYFKQSNTAQDQWSDLVNLCRVLDTEPDASFADAVRRTLHVDAWLRYFALETLVDNRETNLGNGNNGTGQGDDYQLYFGRNDPRAIVIPYDLDTILGLGDTSFDPNAGLFRMAANPQVARFIQHPEFAPAYHAMLLDLARSDFAPARFNPLVDEVLGDLADATVRQRFKDFAAARLAGVLAQIPVTLSATNAASTFANGTYQTSAAAIALHGHAHAATTRSVLVNGTPAAWSAWDASWTNAAVALRPGLNRVLVQSLDASGRETARLVVPVLSTASAGTTTGGTIATTTHWTRAGSPWHVTASVTVAAGATLVVEPGVTVQLAAGANLTIQNGGRLLAEGTASEPVAFIKEPNASNWGGITLNGGPGSPETRLVHAWIDGNGSPAFHSNAGTLVLDHVAFGNTSKQYLSLDASSFVVSHCHFPHPTAEFEPLHGADGIKAGGVGILRHCFVGAPKGYNDAFDFTGGNRPGQPILQVLHNVFAGSGDDQLDLDGTDAWIEGNLFLHVHRNGSPDSASAVSGGSNAGQTSEVTIVGNLFYDCDQAVTAKQGNFYAVLRNTVVRITREGGLDSESAVFNLADDGTTAAKGLLLEDNLIADAEALARNLNPASSTVTLRRNLLPAPWNGPGESNRVARPIFVHVPGLAETFFDDFESAQVLRAWLRQAPSSPGAGLAGFDAPLGARIDGLPQGLHRSSDLTLRVGPFATNDLPAAAWPGGAGIIQYRWSLDDGPWSEWTPSSMPLVLTQLAEGVHQLAVVGLNDAGLAQDDPRLGDDARVTRTAPWSVEATGGRLLIHEVLARNHSIATGPGAFADAVELFNDSAAARDLGGVGFASRSNQPPAFRFAPGTILAAGARLVLTADGDLPASATNIPFGLDAAGDGLWLIDRNGAVLDGVTFGPQLADRSLGRREDGSWALCEPTLGRPNQPVPTGTPEGLRINEWLAASAAQFSADFVEVHNTGDLPVPTDGLFLTDNPIGLPRRHALAARGFVEARGYLAWVADGDAAAGPDHLGFKLDAGHGVLQLATADAVIDTVFYGPQFDDVAQGRSPNGSTTLRFLSTPTPGSGNPGGSGSETNVVTASVDVVPFNQAWRFYQAGAPPAGWMNPSFNDAAWAAGNALFYVGSDSFTLPKNTALTLGKSAYYFRTHFTPALTNPAALLRIQTLIDDGALVWLNGQPLYRQNLNPTSPAYSDYAASTVSKATFNGPTDVPATWLLPGDNVLAVEVHQANASSSDLTFALRLFQQLTSTNISSGIQPLVLNEVVARNDAFPEPNGALVDWVELHNPNPTALDIGGLALTDDPGQPGRFVFPTGTLVGGHGFVRVQLVAPSSGESPATNGPAAAFGLNADGDRLYLLDTAARARALLDSVSFGGLPRNLALARVPDGSGPWTLSQPTPGTTNHAVALGNAAAVSINEWMANPSSGDDWIELHNPGPLPVDLSGWHLTDNLTQPTKHRLPPNTFLGTGPDAYLLVQADGTAGVSASHAPFKLDAKGESIGLATPDGALVQWLSFGASAPGVSEGRFPDDAPAVVRFPTLPTPGAANRADADRDGLPDDWEVANGLSPAVASDAWADLDGDGASNRLEWAAGTDPRDPASVLSLLHEATGMQELTVSFVAVGGRSYILQVAPTPDAATWDVGLRIPARPARRDIRATVPFAGDARFVRVVVE